MEEIVENKLRERAAVSSAGWVDESLAMLFGGPFSALTLEESVQQDFASIGLEYLESLL